MLTAFNVCVKATKRQLSPEQGHSKLKRLKTEEEDSGERMKNEEEERQAEMKLTQLQKLAENSLTERADETKASSLLKSHLKSSWQKIDNLLLYTAAGCQGRTKVWQVSVEQGLFHLWLTDSKTSLSSGFPDSWVWHRWMHHHYQVWKSLSYQPRWLEVCWQFLILKLYQTVPWYTKLNNKHFLYYKDSLPRDPCQVGLFKPTRI